MIPPVQTTFRNMRPPVAIEEQIRAEVAKLAIFYDRMTPNHSFSWDPVPLLNPLLERQEVLLRTSAFSVFNSPFLVVVV